MGQTLVFPAHVTRVHFNEPLPPFLSPFFLGGAHNDSDSSDSKRCCLSLRVQSLERHRNGRQRTPFYLGKLSVTLYLCATKISKV